MYRAVRERAARLPLVRRSLHRPRGNGYSVRVVVTASFTEWLEPPM